MSTQGHFTGAQFKATVKSETQEDEFIQFFCSHLEFWKKMEISLIFFWNANKKIKFPWIYHIIHLVMRPSWKLIVQTICQTNQAIATNPIGALCLAGGNEAKVLRQVENAWCWKLARWMRHVFSFTKVIKEFQYQQTTKQQEYFSLLLIGLTYLPNVGLIWSPGGRRPLKTIQLHTHCMSKYLHAHIRSQKSTLPLICACVSSQPTKTQVKYIRGGSPGSISAAF